MCEEALVRVRVVQIFGEFFYLWQYDVKKGSAR